MLWATEQEGFPALVVHGPLVQQALLDYVRDRLGKEQQENGGVGSFHARATAPAWCNEPLTLTGACGDEAGTFVVRAHGPSGAVMCDAGGEILQ